MMIVHIKCLEFSATIIFLPVATPLTLYIPPSSICQEECQMVQDKCQETWNAVLVVIHAQSIKPVIDCSDTSKILFPVPHCCTGVRQGMLI